MAKFKTLKEKLDWLCTSDGSSQKNPGAEWVCAALHTEFGETSLDKLVEFGIRGKDLYVLFLMRYHRDVTAMYKALINGTALEHFRILRSSVFYQGVWGPPSNS